MRNDRTISAVGSRMNSRKAVMGDSGVRGLIRTPIEEAAKLLQSERMRLGALLRRGGEKRVPDVELAIR
ncbi:hypothetical protein GCM10008937_02080 [Deinococcus depolymerans]|uniref:Uncharacterized protein n=1 Tax=Deinococcus depolymerans TaxID=392408 RepID=A0ABN1BID4_9DEIO